MKIKVYVEGGGNVRELRSKCRRGFSSFFGKANPAGGVPEVIACGDRMRAYDKFEAALRATGDQAFVTLLVDSEGPVAEGAGPWRHLRALDNRPRPDGATDDHAHLMVQCMEAWFLADKGCLAEPRSGIGPESPKHPVCRDVVNTKGTGDQATDSNHGMECEHDDYVLLRRELDMASPGHTDKIRSLS